MKIAIIVLNYNNYKDTIACINSLHNIINENVALYLVDNKSSDDSVKILDKFIHKECKCPITFIKNEKNFGYAGGNNRGIEYAMKAADYDYYWILNNDTVVPEESFHKLLTYSQKNPLLLLIGTVQVFYDNPKYVQLAGGRYYPSIAVSKDLYKNTRLENLPPTIQNADYPSGASLFVKSEYVEKVGMLSEDYFLYYEEIDWIVRGKKIFCHKFWNICRDCIILHKEGGTDKRQGQKRSLLSEYYFHRNRIRFTKKYYKKYLISVYFFVFFSFLKRLLTLRVQSAINILRAISLG